MRDCRTINDLVELLSDYDTIIELTDGSDLHVLFVEKLNKNLNICRVRTHLWRTNFAHRAKAVVSALINSPEFWRKTTVADRLGRFAMVNTQFGKLKVTKRAKQPLTITCETPEFASKLFKAIQQSSDN